MVWTFSISVASLWILRNYVLKKHSGCLNSLLQVLCQYIIPRLTTQHLDIEKHETPREVQITIVDTDGNVKEKVKETTEVVSMLD